MKNKTKLETSERVALKINGGRYEIIQDADFVERNNVRPLLITILKSQFQAYLIFKWEKSNLQCF